MFWPAFTLATLLFSFPFTALGENKEEKKPDSSPQTSASSPLSKKVWIDNVKTRLPTLLCEKDHYFVQCFTITPAECTSFAKLLVEACVNNITLALPPELSAEQGEYWGQVVGRCSYDLYEKLMSSKKRNTQNCQIANTSDAKLPKLPSTQYKNK